ncbi:MAG TPA: SIMPL domain-containing protein [Gaiellales bacterium]|jgi:hypothetical protein
MRARPIVLTACALALGLAAFTALRPAGSSGALPAAQAATGGAGDSHTLTFGGSGSIDLHPDTATVQLTTVGDAATSQEALDATTQKMNAVIAAMKALTTVSIADDDLQTGGISSYQDWDSPRQWHATQTLTVTLHDVSKAGVVIAAGNTAGADQVEGPDYSVTDQRAAYRTALRAALADARQKADVVAQAMGGSVAGVISVTEDDDAQVTPMYAMAKSSGAASDTQAPPVEQGTLSVSAGVTVVFAYAG